LAEPVPRVHAPLAQLPGRRASRRVRPEDSPMSGPDGVLLDVKDLRTQFATDDGLVRAVDGVSFHVGKGEVLGIVGESGCGKSVTNLSVLGLLPKPQGRIAGGSIRFEGRELVGLPE